MFTTVVAVIIHVALVGAIVLTTLFATDVVDVPDSIDAVIVSAPPPPPPPPPPPAAAAPKAAARPQPAKVVQTVAPRPAPTPQPLPQVAAAAPVAALPEAPAAGSASGSPVPVGSFGVEKGIPGGTAGGTIGGVVSPSAPPPPPPPKEPPPAPKGPVRVGGKISAPQVVHRVNPEYPPVAQQSRVGGDVVLEAVVGTDGRVQSVRVVKSHPLLEAAAVNAVKQWRYEPLRLNGTPVPFVLTVTVAFTVR